MRRRAETPIGWGSRRQTGERCSGPVTLLLVALAGALVALVLTRWLRSWRGSRRARRRAGRAVAGEDAAAALLRNAGYEIVGRQIRQWWSPTVDGEPCETEVRADYLVRADGEVLVAEVKTGDEAPQLSTAATRRQLLEYHVAFEVDGVLLVCPERGAIHRVEFPIRAGARGPRT
jgi:hypothetical protein